MGNMQRGSQLMIWDCNGLAQQQFVYSYHEETFHTRDGKMCVDIPGGNVHDGTKLWLWDCNGHINQHWTPPSGPGSEIIAEELMLSV